jgi:hypothetical protein
MQIRLTSVMLQDQETALRFYTGTLGLVKKHDIARGGFRWLTVTAPEAAVGVELALVGRHLRQPHQSGPTGRLTGASR